MKPSTQGRTVCTALALGALLYSAGVPAQPAWPGKPIRWVVPFPAGGGTDQTSRAIAENLSAALGPPVLVDNKPGANTLIGAQAVATAAADGHTVLFATLGTLAVLPHIHPRMRYAPDALVPVAQLVRFPPVPGGGCRWTAQRARRAKPGLRRRPSGRSGYQGFRGLAGAL